MNEEIKLGSTVKLKSGGPLMTVTYLDESTSVCTWFYEGNIKNTEINVVALKVTKSSKGVIAKN